MYPDRGLVELRNPKDLQEPSKDFTFDAIYNENSKQLDLYDETFRDLVDSVLNGFNGTIFAYGQTGTGKTYTMEEERGVIYNCFEHIFQHIARSRNQQFLVRASYLEIYQEELRDLLSKDDRVKLELKEKPDVGVYVKDLTTFLTKSVEEIQRVMAVGNANRSVGYAIFDRLSIFNEELTNEIRANVRGSYKNQPIAVSSWQCYIGIGGWKKHAHTVSRQ
ncbi:kinesin motor domain protein [Ancylostoma ceylanicum]|uniref:Kinesin motor domain protein n=1 Tax=Ancylostoma ceylanicum TaxID=53326 RepID=A0A0D6LT25_9BILA|nr:kinesin motor domain protein [Ancylostoma ceylanicum]